MFGLDKLKLNLGCACVAASLVVPLSFGSVRAAEQPPAAVEVAFVEAVSRKSGRVCRAQPGPAGRSRYHP